MAELLETIMLICFGVSWPLSVYKNIKLKTAKSMSLGFIIMITLGYIAGINAKICSNNYSYVLVAYIINLIFVSSNIVVYIINKQHDKKGSVSK